VDQFDLIRSIKAPDGFAARVLASVGLIDRYAVVTSPLGATFVALGRDGITAVTRSRSEEEFVSGYLSRFGRKLQRSDDLAPSLERALSADSPDVPVDLRGCSPFQRAVLEATREISVGRIRSYAWIAARIGRPGAVRAVGTALARNPVPLVIPCHRIVRSNGSIGEYAFGAEQKASLLVREGIDLEELRRRMPLRSVWHVEGEDTFCHPFCYDVRPLSLEEMHVTIYASPREALAHGLHPCATCNASLAA
jgi:methylated-DNA-[protein]-cysteine S-methyltransferase